MDALQQDKMKDLGYRKLGPTAHIDVTKAEQLAEQVRQSKFYDVRKQGDDRWVRDIHRCKGATTPWSIRHVSTVTAKNYTNKRTLDFLDDAPATDYKRENCPAKMSRQDMFEISEAAKNSQSRFQSFSMLSRAISLCPQYDLRHFLRYHAFPSFFRLCPGGLVLFLESNYEMEDRFRLVRVLSSMTHFELTDIEQGSDFRAMHEWQDVSTLTQPGTIIDLIGVAFFPQVYLARAWRPGLNIVLVLDPADKFQAVSAPANWMSTIRSSNRYAMSSEYGSGPLPKRGSAEAEAMARPQFRTNSAFSAPALAESILWTVERYSALSWRLLDPCEFLDENECVDPVACFEYSLTLDRVLLKATSCVASEEVSDRKDSTFQVADLLEALRSEWVPSLRKGKSGTFFKVLFHPEKGPALLEQAFSCVPNGLKTYLLGASAQVYSELQSKIAESILAPTKRTATGIFVKGRSLRREREEPLPELTSNVMRALRNTGHGYLTKSDPGRRPSRYLSIVSGDTPDSMNMLGVLWTFAMLACPKTMLGWEKPIPLASFRKF